MSETNFSSIPTMREEASKFISHSIIMFPFRIYAMAIQFAVSVILARMLNSQGYGQWGLILALSQWGYTFFLLWSASTLSRYGREEFLTKGHIRSSFTSRMIFFIPGIAVLIIIAVSGSNILANYIHSPRSLLILITLYSIGLSLSDTVQYIFPAIGRSDLSSPVLALERTAVLGLLALFYKFNRFDPAAPLIAYLSASWLVNIPVIFIYRKIIFPWKKDSENLKRYWKLAKPVLIISPFGSLLGWVDLFFIDHFGSLQDVGRYFLAFQFSNALVQLSFIITMASTPLTIALIMKNRKDLEKIFIGRMQYLSVTAGAAIALGVTPLIWMVFKYVGSSNLEMYQNIWAVLMPGCIAQFSLATISSFYNAKEDTWTPGIIGVYRAVISLLLDIALIPVFGAIGAGIATSTGTLFYYVLLFWKLKKFELDPGAKSIFFRILLCVLPAILVKILIGVSYSYIAIFATAFLLGLFAVVTLKNTMINYSPEQSSV